MNILKFYTIFQMVINIFCLKGKKKRWIWIYSNLIGIHSKLICKSGGTKTAMSTIPVWWLLNNTKNHTVLYTCTTLQLFTKHLHLHSCPGATDKWARPLLSPLCRWRKQRPGDKRGSHVHTGSTPRGFHHIPLCPQSEAAPCASPSQHPSKTLGRHLWQSSSFWVHCEICVHRRVF